MAVRLRNLSWSFFFTYDSLRNSSAVAYPAGSRIESAWVPPTPSPRADGNATPSACAKPSQTYANARDTVCFLDG